MRERTHVDLSRRAFIGGTLAAAAILPAMPALSAAGFVSSPSDPVASVGLTAAETAFTEALVRARCPANHLTPDGVASGLASAIERHLRHPVDALSRRQRELFRLGIAAADRLSRERFGRSFHELAPADARPLLRSMAAGDIDTEFAFSSWSSEVVDPLLIQASFTGPVYDIYGTTMFWKLFG